MQRGGCRCSVDCGALFCKCKDSFSAREEKEREGEDLYGTFVPAQSVENVLRVAPTTCFLRLTPAVATS